jgi:hypothetical protein
LTVISSDRCGAIDFAKQDWKSASVAPIAVSESRKGQEAMLLMKPLDCIRTTLGVWQLKTDPRLPHAAGLELLEDGVGLPR